MSARDVEDAMFAVGAEVRRRNRAGDDGEKGAISTSCELAATELVLNALTAVGYRIVPPGGLDAASVERCAQVAKDRHQHWRMPHPDDANPFEVCDDVSACEDIAAALRSLIEEQTPATGVWPDWGDSPNGFDGPTGAE